MSSNIYDAATDTLTKFAGSSRPVDVMVGATNSTDGSSGKVPAPSAGDQDKVLLGDGTWGKKLQVDIVTENNQTGYINGNNEFVPFKSQADVDAAAAAARVGTATAADVLAGKTFTNSSNSGASGSMPDNSTRTSNGEVPGVQNNFPNQPVRDGMYPQYQTGTDGVRRFVMAPPKGYYPGATSYIGAPAQTKTCTPSTSQQIISRDSGKALESVIVKAMPTRFQIGRLRTRKNIDGWEDTWSTKTWTGLTSFYGYTIWTDGTNIYRSNGSSQYILDKSTSTWSAKTWTGLTNFNGSNVWTDGTNIYYSNDSDQYVLNKSTSTWTAKTWNGLTSFNGIDVWSDGDNIYYSNSSDQYVLDKYTSTWSAKTWNELTNFRGDYIWTDGTNIYCSNDSDQYVLNKSTSTWTAKIWNELTNFYGGYVWTDGTNIYYSRGTDQYILDKSTSTWSAKTWIGLTNFDSSNVWTDGTDIYYSVTTNHYILTKVKTHWLV